MNFHPEDYLLEIIIIAILFVVRIIYGLLIGGKKKKPVDKDGYVYIVSNEGSFGQNCFKVGMTRRRDPMVRIKELSDASVPFPFTVHCFIETEDAPKLEAEFHRDLTKYRVNRVNQKKEFFFIDINDLKKIVKKRVPKAKFRTLKHSQEWIGSMRWNYKVRTFK